MTKVYISLEKNRFARMVRYFFAYLFLTFPAQFSKSHDLFYCHAMSRRLGYKARQNNNNETSFEPNESPKPVIFNENDTDKIYHEDIFIVF